MTIVILLLLVAPIATIGSSPKSDFVAAIQAKVHPDEVLDLPGLTFRPNFKHYSGYLKASETRRLHYWFVESQNDPSTDPIVLWMNGGPGCSSLDGLLSELGPFHLREDGKTVYENPYAWNKIANIVFLEAPAGVGYSYSKDGNVTTDDDLTSLLNYHAMKDFFTKFPQYKSHDFYITGESYGGIYVPTLAVRFIEGTTSFPIKLKGIATGNGMLSSPLNNETLVQFAYNHGLIGQKLFKSIETNCCHGCVETCDLRKVGKVCDTEVDKVMNTVEGIGLNVYDVYRQCDHPKSTSQYRRYWFDLKAAFPKHKEHFESLRVSQSGGDQKGLGDEIPCLNDTRITIFLNQPSVRKALHIPSSLPSWTVCSGDVGSHYHTLYADMTEQFREILGEKIRILVYNGDTDMACNFLMGERFVSSLRLPLTNDTRAWWLGDQIAGFVTQYRYLDFLTVKGAGHMVPQWRPPQALKMITSFIKNQRY